MGLGIGQTYSFSSAAQMQAFCAANGRLGNQLWDIAANDWVGGDFPVRISGRNASDFYGTPGCPVIFDGVAYSFNGATSTWVTAASTSTKPTRFSSRRLLNQVTGQNNYPGYTLCHTLQGPPGGFTGCVVIFENHDTTRSANIDLAAIAPTAYKNANGPFAISKNITLGGARAGIIPAATPGVGNGNGNTPGMLVSDPISFDSIARADGGTIPMVAIRAQTNSGNVAPQYPLATWESAFATMPDWEGQYVELSPAQNQTGSGDWVTGMPSISGFSPAWHNYWLKQFCRIVFFAKGQNIKNFAGFGDSIMIGQGSERGCTGPLMKMEAINGQCVTNFASGGQKRIDTSAIMRAVEPTLPRNSYVCFFAASPNDGSTQDLWDASYALMLSDYDYLASKGHIPIVFTSVPWGGKSVVTTINARIASSGLLYFDAYASINDPANPNNILPAYDSGDHLHLNDDGNAKLGADFATWVRTNL